MQDDAQPVFDNVDNSQLKKSLAVKTNTDFNEVYDIGATGRDGAICVDVIFISTGAVAAS